MGPYSWMQNRRLWNLLDAPTDARDPARRARLPLLITHLQVRYEDWEVGLSQSSRVEEGKPRDGGTHRLVVRRSIPRSRRSGVEVP